MESNLNSGFVSSYTSLVRSTLGAVISNVEYTREILKNWERQLGGYRLSDRKQFVVYLEGVRRWVCEMNCFRGEEFPSLIFPVMFAVDQQNRLNTVDEVIKLVIDFRLYALEHLTGAAIKAVELASPTPVDGMAELTSQFCKNWGNEVIP